MKRFFSLFLCLCLSMGVFTISALAAPEWPSDVSIQADGGIVMDADTGTVLYGKNMDQPYYPASITKILTALIVLEHCDLDEMVSFSHDDVYNVEAGSSSAGIDEGDVLTVRDCWPSTAPAAISWPPPSGRRKADTWPTTTRCLTRMNPSTIRVPLQARQVIRPWQATPLLPAPKETG